ncbi:MAG: hypothetical protein ACREO4_05455 [Lysobacter sp.]
MYPSFTDEELRRRYGTTTYFFDEVELVHLAGRNGNEVLGICGRFIKDTTLTREQVYVEGQGLMHDRDQMQSSPSALFLLILNSHRLVYVKETVDAPPKEAFRSTLLSFLRQVHARVLKEKLSAVDAGEMDRDAAKEAKDQIREQYQRPTLELIALTSEESIEEFISKYEVLTQIRIVLSERNDEADLDEFFNQMQHAKDSIGSADTTLTHRARDGLDKDEAISQVAAATAQGNQSVTLRGSDEGGDTLIGNNEKFQLRTPLENLSSDPEAAADQMFEAFSDLANRGLIQLPNIGKRTARAIAAIFAEYFDERR